VIYNQMIMAKNTSHQDFVVLYVRYISQMSFKVHIDNETHHISILGK